MKTIILYASKYGAAEEIAKRISAKIDGSVILNLKEALPALEDFDSIIFGSSVYAGSIRKEAKTFLAKNADVLLQKKLGLFLCGLGAESKDKYFNDNFSPELLEKAKEKDFLGGIFDPKKANGFERLIIKLITKKSEYIDFVNDRKIEKFAENMKA